MDLFNKLAEIRKKRNKYTGDRRRKAYREMIELEEAFWREASDLDLRKWAVKTAAGMIITHKIIKKRYGGKSQEVTENRKRVRKNILRLFQVAKEIREEKMKK